LIKLDLLWERINSRKVRLSRRTRTASV